MSTKPQKVAILTAGGLAPCLSAAIGKLICVYTDRSPETKIICYRYGYRGLLCGDSFVVTDKIRANAGILKRYGGSPIGSSRVKLTNVADCVKRGLIQPGQNPQQVAAEQLRKDCVDVLHIIGGDDTNTSAADLEKHLSTNGYPLIVLGLPKTIDNDIVPVRQSLGSLTAAEQGAKFFQNVVTENGASSRMLILHEIMGRHSGWLAAATMRDYMCTIDSGYFLPEIGLSPERWFVHGVYLPEFKIDMEAEAARLASIIDQHGVVNLFVSEGAGVKNAIAEIEKSGEAVARDAFGHVCLDEINVGAWFGKQFKKLLGAEKVLIQKSGYFARSAAANDADLLLISRCAEYAVECALLGSGSGLVAEDEESGDKLRTIEFPRVKGGKEFDIRVCWFQELLVRAGQKTGCSRRTV